MLRLAGLSENALADVLAEQARARLTYPEVGGTKQADLPPGYVHDRHRIPLADRSFDVAKRGLREWRAHLGAGVSVFPQSAPIEPDVDVVLGIRTGPLYAIAACRIVYVCDEPDRFGFGYGTLPGHPETGEEAFIVERDPAERVHFAITAFSRPASTIARVGSPIARIVQRRVTNRYLEAMRGYTAPAT